MRLDRTLKNLFADMTEDERRTYLESLNVGLENWTGRLNKIFSEEVRPKAMEGKGPYSKDMREALLHLKTAIEFVSGHASRVSTWKQLMASMGK